VCCFEYIYILISSFRWCLYYGVSFYVMQTRPERCAAAGIRLSFSYYWLWMAKEHDAVRLCNEGRFDEHPWVEIGICMYRLTSGLREKHTTDTDQSPHLQTSDKSQPLTAALCVWDPKCISSVCHFSTDWVHCHISPATDSLTLQCSWNVFVFLCKVPLQRHWRDN